jgi:hypothetical protein
MQIFDHNIGFWEKRQFFAENWKKSQKIEIITSTPEMYKQNGQKNYPNWDLHIYETISGKCIF